MKNKKNSNSNSIFKVETGLFIDLSLQAKGLGYLLCYLPINYLCL